ncbi:MAG: DoxX family protein [Ginsengibacter sp.]
MSKVFSARYNAGAFNIGMLILRMASGVLIIHHGYQKLSHYNEMKSQFMNFMGFGPSVSFGLVIFAEFFCGILLVLGLFTRFACIPLVILMVVILYKVHALDIFGKGEMDMLYLASFLTILFCGPGMISVDSRIGK